MPSAPGKAIQPPRNIGLNEVKDAMLSVVSVETRMQLMPLAAA
jgi:hypothetical protein